MELTFDSQQHNAKALLDTGGGGGNYLSYHYLLQQGFRLEGELPAPIRLADGKTTPCYGRPTLTAIIPDSNNTKRSYYIPFNVIELAEYDLILGRTWLGAVGVSIDCAPGTWRYPSDPKIQVTNPRRFSKISRNEAIFLISPADPKPDNKNGLPQQYHDYSKVFSEKEARILASEEVTHTIETESDKTPPYGTLYPLTPHELDTLRRYIDEMLVKGWIRPSSGPAAAPVLFVKKPDGGLRLCVDYRKLNAITVKNRYPLPRIDEMFDRLSGAKIFSKLDLRDAYHRIRIRRGDEWKTAFRTRYGQFEYLVMPFGLCNAPATFQAYINSAMRGILDDYVVVYLDDILIFSQNETEHEQHVREVLRRLQQHNLYAKLLKCEFHRRDVRFLGLRVGADGVSMDPDRVDTIKDWPMLESFHDIQVFLGFTGFFRQFVENYARITAPLTDMLRGMERGRKKGPFQMTEVARRAFDMLKQAFMEPPVLRHFDYRLPTLVVTDASQYAVAAIILQPGDDSPAEPRVRDWHPIAYFSRKLNDTERRYEVHDQELLAIIDAFKRWRHYLLGSQHPIRVQTDHANLRYFFTTKTLNQRQARWAELLAAYDFIIEYKPGERNPADAPSRRRDYRPTQHEAASGGMLPTLQRKLSHGSYVHCLTRERSNSPEDRQAGGLEGPELLVPRSEARLAASQEVPVKDTASCGLCDFIRTLQRGDAPTAQRIRTLATPSPEGNTLIEKGWRVDDGGLLRLHHALHVPRDPALIDELLQIYHDDPYAGHLGQEKTLDLIERKFHWDGLRDDVKSHVTRCPECQYNTVPRRRPYGQLSSLPVPEGPWQSVSLDFLTGVPPCGRQGNAYDAILVLVDRYTKAAKYIPTTKKLKADELADLFMQQVVYHVGAPRSLVSDRDSLFTSDFWREFCSCLRIKQRMSTAFHPQTDGQTERQNQTLEAYLRNFVTHRQDDWVDWLGIAAFAYNNAKHSSLGTSPFYANHGFNPNLPRDVDLSEVSKSSLENRFEKLREVRGELEERLRHAAESQAKQYNQKHNPMSFAIGDRVLLSTKNLNTRRPSKKLDRRFEGPFEVINTVGKQAYTLRLPKKYGRIHPTFHVSLLKPWTRQEDAGEPQEVSQVVDNEDEVEWEVEEILAHRQQGKGR